MTGERVIRRLAAVLAADVVGYSRLMGRDESGTLHRLRAHRTERLEPILQRRGGRTVKLTGDGALIEFASGVEAVSAAIEFQQAMAEANRGQHDDTAIVFRIGVHLGDLIVEGDDLYGDGINVAARLEGEAPPGGIVVSGALHEVAYGRVDADFEDLGRLRLKNIERPVQAYAVRWGEARAVMAKPAPAEATLTLPDKPSIVVLPFANMSGDPEQGYFVDGLVEDIITALSRFKSLFVIARNSSFTYKGKAVDVKQVSRDLGVRYILEGSVRRVAGRVRITGQLIDSQTGANLWAEHFDGTLEDIFELQDQVTARLVGAVAPRVTQAEIERAKRKPVGNVDAYDCFLRGSALFEQRTQEAQASARKLFEQAIELDPAFSTPYAMLIRCHSTAKLHDWPRDPARAEAEVRRLANVVSALGADDASALSASGFGLAWVCRDYEAAVAFVDRALLVNPNLVDAWMYRAVLSAYGGDHNTAIEQFGRAQRISPIGPDYYLIQGYLAYCYCLLRQHDRALRAGSDAASQLPRWLVGHVILAVVHGLEGSLEQARKSVAQVQRLSPTFRLPTIETWPFQRAEDRSRLVEGLRLAGMPE